MAKQEQPFSTGLLIRIGVGLITGTLTHQLYQRKKTLNPNDILDTVKQAFLKEGPIEGSWIEFSKKPYRQFAVETKIYIGGITRKEDQELVQYEFIADAFTGTVIDLYRI